MEDIGRKIRLRRKQLGLTQTQLATKAEVSQQTIAALENGYVRKTSCLPTVFHVLGLDINMLMQQAGATPVEGAHSLITPQEIDTITETIRNMLNEMYSFSTYESENLVIALGDIDEVSQTICDEIVKKIAMQRC